MDRDSTTSLGSVFQYLAILSMKKVFLVLSLNLPTVQLKIISSHPVTCHLRNETNTLLAAASFQAVVERDEVSPQSPLLQTKNASSLRRSS